MDRFLSHYGAVTDVLSRIVMAAASIIVGLIVVSLFAESVARYLLSSSRAFMEEFPRLFLPFIVFPLMGALLKAERHISVDVLPVRLKGRSRTGLMIVVYAVVLAVAVPFFVAGLSAVAFFKNIGMTSETEYPIPMWWVYSAFPVGFALLIIFDLELLLKAIWTFVKKEGGDRPS